MRTKTFPAILFIVALSLGMLACPKKSKVCIDFERPLVAGTEYGQPNPTQPPGTVVFTANGIPVSVQNFIFLDGREFFGSGSVVTQAPATSIGSGQKMQIGNINLEFDFSRFSSLGLPTSQVQFTFLDMGGFENISVNGSQVFVGELSTVPSQLGGVGVIVNSTALPSAPGNPASPGKKGTVTLTGAVNKLRIGGQEFWIDNVCVKR